MSKTAAKSSARKTKTVKKSIKKVSPKVKVKIRATFNNTLVTVTDTYGNVLAWSSAGNCGFKGSRKSTPFAASTIAEKALKHVVDYNGAKEADIDVAGPGPGRDAALKAVAVYLKVGNIRDCTAIPHNGCRQPKKRRV